MSPLKKTYREVLDRPDSLELVLNIPSFAGGENTIGQDQELKSNEARVIENWDSDSLGGMIRSKGFTSVCTGGATYSTAPDCLLHHFEGTSTRDYVVVGGDLAYINGSAITQTDAAKFTSDVLTCGLSAGNKAWFTNSTDNLKYATISGSLLTPSSIAAVVFSGSGLNDATSGGTYTGSATATYIAIVDSSAASPDTFKWNKNGGSYTTGVSMSAGAHTLSDGVTITFAATDGHTLNDQWTITVTVVVPSSARERIYFHKSRLVAEGGGVTVYGSKAGSGNWAGAGGWSTSGDAWNIDLPDLTQGCAPGFPSGGQITVFTKFGAYALTNFPNVAQNYILGSHGCSHPYSIQIGAEGVYLFSLYPTLGVFLWNGSTWTNLTINEDWVSNVSLTNRCFGIYSENKYRIIYNDSTSGVSYPNVMRIYDARWGRWMNRPINSSVADNFGYPMLRTKVGNELYVASSRNDVIYQLEDSSNSDNTYATQANYKTKDFTSIDFGLPRDEVRMKLLKVTATFYASTGSFSLAWTSDRGLHTGSVSFQSTATGDLLNTTFTVNTSSLVNAPPDKTVTKSFSNAAVGRRFSFQLLNSATGERVKIKKLKIVAVALEEA